MREADSQGYPVRARAPLRVSFDTNAEVFLTGVRCDGRCELERDPAAIPEGDHRIGVAAERVAVAVGVFITDGIRIRSRAAGVEGPVAEVGVLVGVRAAGERGFHGPLDERPWNDGGRIDLGVCDRGEGYKELDAAAGGDSGANAAGS